VTRVLVVDNYDSFVYNLVQYLGQLEVEVVVRRHDEIAPAEVAGLGIDGVLLSPGPKGPWEAGVSVDMVRYAAAERIPLLGVCLGHQAIGVAFGGECVRAPELLHGKTSLVTHTDQGILRGLPNPFTATRYHSLAIDRAGLPAELEVTATTESGVIMGLRHRELPIEGVQFHPESVLTYGGHLMLARWIAECGDERPLTLAPSLTAEVEGLRAAAFS
jgi:para-aminobenzoate synthetase component 2